MDEFRFGQDLVRALLREQHPDLADLELRDVTGGWDNGADAAETLAGFLKALHQQAPADAPVNPARGIPPAGMTGIRPARMKIIRQDQ